MYTSIINIIILQDLEDFLIYLDDWEKIIIAEQIKNQLDNVKTKKSVTDSTLKGLEVTIKSTLDLHKYLHEEEGENLSYIMTCKLNQDALEI